MSLELLHSTSASNSVFRVVCGEMVLNADFKHSLYIVVNVAGRAVSYHTSDIPDLVSRNGAAV